MIFFNRAVFIWVSKVIRVLLWFCFTSLCDWLKNFVPLSPPIRSKTQNQSRLARTRFPALDAGDMYLLPVLIGWLGNLCLLWLAGVITLVLVLRHSFENRSKDPYHSFCVFCAWGWRISDRKPSSLLSKFERVCKPVGLFTQAKQYFANTSPFRYSHTSPINMKIVCSHSLW